MNYFIDIAVVEDNRMLVDSLWAWRRPSRTATHGARPCPDESMPC